MKLGPVWKVIVVVILGCAAVWSISYIDHIPPQRLAALVGISTPSPSQNLNVVDGDQSSALGTVAVQTFSGPVLIKQGSGTAVSVDGLVLTTAVTAPYGSGSFVYQIATPRGQLLRARRVASDASSGLVLLKVEVNDLDAVLFSSTEPSAGAQWKAVSAHVIASRFVAMRLPVWVVWSDAGRQTAVSIDHAYASSMNGARLVDELGRSVGLLRNTVQPGLITAALINVFLDRYLGEVTKK